MKIGKLLCGFPYCTAVVCRSTCDFPCQTTIVHVRNRTAGAMLPRTIVGERDTPRFPVPKVLAGPAPRVVLFLADVHQREDPATLAQSLADDHHEQQVVRSRFVISRVALDEEGVAVVGRFFPLPPPSDGALAARDVPGHRAGGPEVRERVLLLVVLVPVRILSR